jgi:uncharacterized protein YjiS (DUF1127 family)
LPKAIASIEAQQITFILRTFWSGVDGDTALAILSRIRQQRHAVAGKAIALGLNHMFSHILSDIGITPIQLQKTRS